MIISRVVLKNWRNFRSVDVRLGYRMFVIGPNASGKSNFLDVFKFLRDIVRPGGGLQKAISDRGGVSKMRCLAARRDTDIGIDVHLSDVPKEKELWKYSITIKLQPRGRRQPFLAQEKVWKDGELILDRPNKEDELDSDRQTQTHLEQINANKDFRDIARFMASISYLHMIPQLMRFPDAFSGHEMQGDPFGRNLLEHIATTPQKTREKRLRDIGTALKAAVPQLKDLDLTTDSKGIPHLEAKYEHWRHIDAKQREDQFSDGTLRLIGLLWSLLESNSLLLLEEPEMSLHSGLVAQIPSLLYRLRSKNKRQVILSTHSADLLRNKGIGGEEALLLIPDAEGTIMRVSAEDSDIKRLLDSGLSIAEAVVPKTDPKYSTQLSFLE